MMRQMPKIRTTLTIDEDVLRAVKVRGARTGKGDSEVIEEALRRELGFDLLERLWQRNDIGEDDALELAVEASTNATAPALSARRPRPKHPHSSPALAQRSARPDRRSLGRR